MFTLSGKLLIYLGYLRPLTSGVFAYTVLAKLHDKEQGVGEAVRANTIRPFMRPCRDRFVRVHLTGCKSPDEELMSLHGARDKKSLIAGEGQLFPLLPYSGNGHIRRQVNILNSMK